MTYNSSGTELDEALRNWYETKKKELAGMTLLERQDITREGAKIVLKHYRDETRAKHYSNHADKKYGHAADHISMSSVKDNGKHSYEQGATDVGWTNHFHAMNMMRLNDGTKKIPADHFITNIQNDMSIVHEVLEAEEKEFARQIARKEEQHEGGAS